MAKLNQVILKPLFHRGQQCIGIYFERNSEIQRIIQSGADARWSRTHSTWWIPYKRESYVLLKEIIGDKASVAGDECLKLYNEEKPKHAAQIPTDREMKTVPKNGAASASKEAHQQRLPHALSEANRSAFEAFNRQLILKGYSAATIRTYTNEFLQFLNTIRDKPASGFNVSGLKDYFQYCHKSLKLSEATIHSRINALKFYYEQVLGREKFFCLPRWIKKIFKCTITSIFYYPKKTTSFIQVIHQI